jgi:hypothetical protein
MPANRTRDLQNAFSSSQLHILFWFVRREATRAEDAQHTTWSRFLQHLTPGSLHLVLLGSGVALEARASRCHPFYDYEPMSQGPG